MKATLINDLWWGDAHSQCWKRGREFEITDIVLGKHATLIRKGHLYEIRLFEVPLRFLETEEVLPAVAAQFTIDDGTVFSGWHHGDKWNGFACPFFSKEVAEEVCKYSVRGNSGTWKYDEATDTFSVQFNDTRCDDDDDCWDHFEGTDVLVEGGETKRLYSIGGWSWVWDEKDAD